MYSQALEPRLYANVPVDLNFVALGYIYTQGTLQDNPLANLKDAKLYVNTAITAYVRVFDFFGQSAKFDILLPYSKLDGSANFQNQPIYRNTKGLGDIKARLAYNLYGAPSLSLKEFRSYQQDLIIGTSVQITSPTGKYDEDKLVNLGSNRWAIKPSIGASQAFGSFIFELSGAAEFYSDNDEFFNQSKRKQKPIYSTQAHLIYNFNKGIWMGFDANYYWGGQSTTNEKQADDKIEDSRYGFTFSLPFSKQTSVKLYANSGISTRTGTDYNSIGLVLQYAFGGGI